ncbi:MAG: MFS transporter [Deltaproteobacteria bacterium]|nr:MFS transporter [Deltaproteobacteria bacterium]
MRKPVVYYGWWIVLFCFLCLLTNSGCGLFAFSLFVKPLEADFGWGRGKIMMAFTFFGLVMCIIAPFIGKVVDRCGEKTIINTGAFLSGFAFVLLSLTNNIWHFYIGYIAVAVGMAATGSIPTSRLVSNWFEERRGLAIGLMSTGAGGGGIILSPFIGGYLIPVLGWRASYLTLALLIWVLIIPLGLLLVMRKESQGVSCSNDVKTPPVVIARNTSPSTSDVFTLRETLASIPFWLISISFMLSTFSYLGVVMHQVPYLLDIGFPVVTAVGALGAVSLTSAVAKFCFGWLCDRMSPKYACTIGLVLQLTGIIIMMNVGPASHLTIIWLYAITIGLGMGSWLPTMSIITSIHFGLASYGAVFGTIQFFVYLAIASGPLFAGYVFDKMSSYQLAFTVFAVLYAISIPCILMVRRPKKPIV